MKITDKELEQTIEFLIEDKPHSDLARFARQLRPKLRMLMTQIIVKKFMGQAFYVPRKSAFTRYASVVKIKGALEGLEPGSKEFKNTVRGLSRALEMPMHQIRKIFKAGSYVR